MKRGWSWMTDDRVSKRIQAGWGHVSGSWNVDDGGYKILDAMRKVQLS